MAGHLVNELLKDSKSRLYPIDSEHSAIAQCLAGEDPANVRRLLITASGGPFRTWKPEQIANAKAADALKHPNWNMGAKITIDSATMLNKAFEIIEAHHLFHIEPERIEAVVHPQSIVHSMVEYIDGAIKAQLGLPDMHLPIAYALGQNEAFCRCRRSPDYRGLCHTDIRETQCREKFPCLGLAHYALEKKGNSACIINAANEIAVAAFLRDRIRFNDIYEIIAQTLARVPISRRPRFDDYVATNDHARAVAAVCNNQIKQALMEILIKAAQLVLALVILVTIHEFGHYIFARIFGVKVNRFYLFFNPWFSLLRYNPMKGTLEIIASNKADGSPKAMATLKVGKEHSPRPDGKPTWRDTIYGLGWVPLGWLLRHSRHD